MTDDLERALRTMLAERAGDIHSVPNSVMTLVEHPFDAVGEVVADDEVLELGLRRADILRAGRRLWPLLVAAAAVIAVVGGVLALLVGSTGHDDAVPPAHPGPQVKTFVRQSCRTTVPASWASAVSMASTNVPSITSDDVVAVTDDGGAVIEHDNPGTETVDSSRFGYLAPGAAAVHWLATLRAHFGADNTLHSFEFDVDVTGHTAVITTATGHQYSVPRSIEALDLETGRQTLLATSSPQSGVIEHQAYALNGIAYWEAKVPSADPKHPVDTIFSRPVAGGAPRWVAFGDQYDLQKSALGIEWNLDDAPPDRPAAVPALVMRHGTTGVDASNAFDSYLNDGHVYAWQTLAGDLDWYDASTGRLIRVPHLLGLPGVNPGQAALFAVSGPIVYYQDQQGTGDRILDVRTGADMSVPHSGSLLGAGGKLIGSPNAVIAHASAADVLSLKGAALPAAHC